ncbi:TetR/AcrR family transcriptional regulator [Pseudonocardia acidicola]|uniref:TetR/AcrR family transcriptional regulator n=1 Tax=Pseudonocardia acidicola TaxID=2724939 RepID=A0ABX1SGL3_9PSEU|nr:TetR/AcrR family transcriptional regulator [Pseudonocardia acidicola]NMH99526.1 TetR/AcrR family transcriptional regulator [Pseudonocardia acidicola]
MSPTRTLEPDVSQRLLDAAERLFYARGVQAVGIDAVVAEAGVATKTLYAHFGSKDGLVEAYLRRRDQRWLNWLRGAVAAAEPGPARVLAVFDALGEWFGEPAYNGCAFINVAGELAASPAARATARDHKLALRALLNEVAAGAGVADPAVLAERLMLLVEGAIVTAHVEGDADAALRGRSAAEALLEHDRLTGATAPPRVDAATA